MSGLALKWNVQRQECDLVVADPQQPAAALETAVLISLFTDRRASADDELPEAGADRRGWWGDVLPSIEGDQIGSRLWLLARGKRTQETIRRARDYAAEALDWMVVDQVAAGVTVETAAWAENGIALVVEITRPNGRRQRFDFLWNRA